MTRKDIYGERPPNELLAYGLLVRRRSSGSPSTRRLWACGAADQNALSAQALRSPVTLSFSNLIEAFTHSDRA